MGESGEEEPLGLTPLPPSPLWALLPDRTFFAERGEEFSLKGWGSSAAPPLQTFLPLPRTRAPGHRQHSAGEGEKGVGP